MPWIMIVFLWLLINAVGISLQSEHLMSGYARGPDSYVRLVRVEELFATFDWYQARIIDLGYPLGADIHWTRPLDVIILLLAAPLMIFMTTGSAIFWAGVSVSAISTLAAAVAFVWAIRPMLPRDAPDDVWILPASALMAQPIIFAYSVVGRADHHITLVVMFIIAVGFLLRSLEDSTRTRDALYCGVAMGVGLWMSVELLVALLPVAAVFALVWIRGTGSVAQGVSFAKGMTLAVVVAIVAENPPGELWVVAYDRISVVHLTLAAGMLAFWWAVAALGSRMGFAGRIAAVSLAAVLGGALMWSLFPGFFVGPMVDVDVSAEAVWAANVKEMRSIFPTSYHTTAEFVMILGNGLFAIPYCIRMLRRAVSDRQRNLWLAALLLLGASVPAAVLHVRFSLYTEVVFLIIIATAWATAQTGILRRDGSLRVALLRALATVAILIGATAIGGGLIMAERNNGLPDAADNLVADVKSDDRQDVEPNVELGCDLKEVGTFLDGASTTPLTVLTLVDYGPALVYHSRQRVLAGPYHRNGAAIVTVRDLLAGSDMERLHTSFGERGIDAVLICSEGGESRFFAGAEEDGASETLYKLLVAGSPPQWLRAADLPRQAGLGARVFAFSDTALAALAADD